MAMTELLAHIDSEIARLQQAKALLSGGETTTAVAAPKSGRGRPKGSKNATSTKTASVAAPAATKSKRKLSPEGRKAIADAMKRRWAERRKTATK